VRDISPEILGASATDLRNRLRSRELSITELLEATVSTIDSLNPTLNAIVTTRSDAAILEARTADSELMHGREFRPLEGLPFTVKDVIATADLRTTAGSRILRFNIPRYTATAVRRLQNAGAILIGKSNCSEFGIGNLHTANRLFGSTRNPRDRTRTPGGSSGGDSAAVAAGLAVFGIGTDYGGSIRWPAHCTGVAGLRPTPGRIPNTGVLPHGQNYSGYLPNSSSLQCWLQTISPIARSATDLPLLLEIMQGADGCDSNAVPLPWIDMAGVDISALRCAWFDGDGSAPVRDDVKDAVANAARTLSSLGLHVAQARPPFFERAAPALAALRRAEGLPDHRRIVDGHEDELTTVVRKALEEANDAVPLNVYRALAEDADAVRARILEFMTDYQILILPVATVPAFTPGPNEAEAPVAVDRSSIEACCRAVTLLRAPSVVIQCGLSIEGLPIGVQIVGRPYRDAEVLSLAAMLEKGLTSMSGADPNRNRHARSSGLEIRLRREAAPPS